MTDYIDRQEALDALGERPLIWTEDDDYSLGSRNQYDKDRLAIETILSADVQPVRHGQWYLMGNSGLATCKCGFITDMYSAYNYCPNCGARMQRRCTDGT